MTDDLPLKSLHSDDVLSKAKLKTLVQLTTEELRKTLLPGQPASLKARPDGTVLDGHHRIKILRDRGFDVDALPREVITKDQ
ncbi:MAG: hypothetical protein ABSB82_25215 [Terriglobia bacterium]|jgi:hypothetical protein